MNYPYTEVAVSHQESGISRRLAILALSSLPILVPLAARADDSAQTIIVTGSRQQAPQAGKSSIPLSETPQNIQLLSSALLIDQGDHLLDEALRNVAGVMPGGYYNGFDYFRIRGFDASGFIYLDGLLYDSGISTNAELFGLDHVEVVKGPASSLYGQGALGGLVNLVSKRPSLGQFLSVSGGYGDFKSYQFTLDGNTSLSDNVAVRLTGVARRDGSFIDFVDGDSRLYLAPSLTWNIDADTSLTILTNAQHDDMNLGFPLPAEGTVFASPYGFVPLSRFNGEPGANNLDETRYRAGYEFKHNFNSVWSVRQNFRYGWADTDWKKLLYPAFLDDSSALTLYRYPYGLQAKWTNVNVDTGLQAEFGTGPLKHTFVAGVDYYKYDYDTFYEEIDYNDLSQYMPLDLIHPVYGTPITPYATKTHNVDHVEALGLYAQEHVKWDPFTLTLGLRWDKASDNAIYANVPQQQDKYALVPRIGITYTPMPAATLYASYSESFKPQLGYSTAAGNAIDPERGQQWEGGIKLSLFGGRMNATASVYELTRQHVATSDPNAPPGSGAFIVTGEQRSRGFEFDSQTQIMPGWELVASYTYVDAKVTRDNDVPIGDHSINVPPQAVTFWTKYAIQSGALEGLAFSIGVDSYASQPGDLPNTFKLPAYTLVNGNIEYTFGHFSALLNLKNITDERYFVGSYNDLYVNPGAPRSALFSITWKY